MSFFIRIITIFLLSLSINKINSYVVLPFNTMFMKDPRINETDYFTNLTQNILYVNFSVGSKKKEIKVAIKGDKNGFLIYQKAYEYLNSDSSESVDDEEGNMKLQWAPQCQAFPSKDNLYLSFFNSYKEFREGKKGEIKMTNKTTFLRTRDTHEENINFFNKMYYGYGFIGLLLTNNLAFQPPEFVKSLKESKNINSYDFHFIFENNAKNGFPTTDNKGYFIIGETLTDIENKKDKINYIDCPTIGGSLSWGLNSYIYLKYNNDDKIIIKNATNVQIMPDYPYIGGDSDYFEFINKIFFNELFDKNICKTINFTKHEIYLSYDFYGYACDSNSKYFMDNLKNKFPDLIFEKKELNLQFILTKNDLFAFNTNNESDTNLYFLIVNAEKKNKWILGIPFLKKYVFSYNYDTKKIAFYENYGKDSEEEEENNNFFSSTAFKIIIIILLLGIVFGLGMLVQYHIKKSRKKRANELEDNYEYESYDDKKGNKEKSENKTEDESLGINTN